ncbi:HAD family hydrolase [Thiomicrorhabdus xiamenensis]|uniref:phosphoglycolate phosphatase n=1 Tax=Thiomicrorhabdus xiamenensis TaxID=2739063 RepID=A0A7D4NRB7_9GAMM|nr:HAD family hydrolase [Thiomicrorhabdus xiamenensis]QKI89772.1 HAD family hydrolase [Thiomicrorhabdus xiamenensis]
MNKLLTDYQTLVFDCDGVVLNSNKIKTQAFYEATKHFGHEPAQALVDYHVANGGVSRYLKFEYFLKEIMQISIVDSILQDLLNRFANAVKQGLMECEVAPELDSLKQKTADANWLIVSGGDQAELREVFKARGLYQLFDGGIFGSPDDKDKILAREKSSKNINGNALFLGDSKYDYKAASKAGLDFVFLSDWTEVKVWQAWVDENKIQSYRNIEDLAIL